MATAKANRRQYERRIGFKNGGVDILLEEADGWRAFGASVVDQSEGGLQILASNVEVFEGALVVVKTADKKWDGVGRRASAKVVWVAGKPGQTFIGCEYIAPLTGIPEFF